MKRDMYSMAIKRPDKQSLRQIFREVLIDVYSAERQLTTALLRMVIMATDERLKDDLDDLLSEARSRLRQLDRLFQTLQLVANEPRMTITGMGLKADARALLLLDGVDTVSDTSIIITVRGLAHGVIQAYGKLVAIASACGFGEYAKVLIPTLEDAARAAMQFSALSLLTPSPHGTAYRTAWIS